MSRLLGLLLVLLLTGCQAHPAPVRKLEEHRGGRFLILPLVMVNAQIGVRPWVWPAVGYGNTMRVDTAALAGGWWHNWGPGPCADPLQVPLVFASPTEVVAAIAAGCNDGRPILISNEPEGSGTDQAHLTPAQVADLVQAAAGVWRGAILCCGTFANAWAYTDAVVTDYEQRFGPWPAAGWHIHAYNNRANWRPDVVASGFTEQAIADVDGFIAHQRQAGRLGQGVVVSEFGALSALWWHRPEALEPLLADYVTAFRARPAVLAWAWFSSHDPRFASSDLLQADGALTALGAKWQTYR